LTMDIPFKRELALLFSATQDLRHGPTLLGRKINFSFAQTRRVLELLIALDLQIFCYLSLRKTHRLLRCAAFKTDKKGNHTKKHGG